MKISAHVQNSEGQHEVVLQHVAEIQNTLRVQTPVILEEIEIISEEGASGLSGIDL